MFNGMEQSKKSFSVKDLEIILWILIPASIIVYSVTKFGKGYLIENPEFILQFFYACFPVLFAVMMKFIVNDYPIAAIINSLKNIQKKE